MVLILSIIIKYIISNIPYIKDIILLVKNYRVWESLIKPEFCLMYGGG